MIETAHKLFTLREIPIGKFQQFLVDSDLSVLGDAPEDVLQRHGMELYFQFCDLIKTDRDIQLMNTDGLILSYSIKIQAVQMCVDALREMYLPEICDILKEEGYDYEFTLESYLADIESVVTEAKQDARIKEDLERQYALMNGGGEVATHEYYGKILNSISKMEGFYISDEIPTSRFCAYYKQLIEQSRQSEDTDG